LGVAPIAILVGSWASNSKYSTLGGLRSAGMMMSYEVLVIVAAASVALHANTLSIAELILYQQSTGVWFIFMQPVAGILFLIGLIASVERNPFDLVEAESELVAGWKTEYGGVYFSFTLLAEYLKLLASAFLFAAIFLGGATGTFGDFGFLLKVLFFSILMFYIRATALRLRIDQIFEKVWRELIPIGMVNFLITNVVLVFGGGL
jgi:NADH-quinone oxidoreductase subunit H